MKDNLYRKNILASYDIFTRTFKYDLAVPDFFGRKVDPFYNKENVRNILGNDFYNRLLAIAEEDSVCTFFETYKLPNQDKWIRVGFMKEQQFSSIIKLIISDVTDEIFYLNHLKRLAEYDELTGLLTKTAFHHDAEKLLEENEEKVEAGKFAIISFDVNKFKGINELFGNGGGDIVLIHIADVIKELTKNIGFGCRTAADRFAIIVDITDLSIDNFIEVLSKKIADCGLATTVSCNFGIYITSSERFPIALMMDRATMAQGTIKGMVSDLYKIFTSDLRDEMLSEQEITGEMKKALKENQFIPYFQPQFDHATGRLVGAEALVRWSHPEKGMIPPGRFIDIFENNGFITVLDLHIFEQVLIFIHDRLEKGLPVIPISTNFSRNDFLEPKFVEKLEKLRNKYKVPVDKIRVELTESCMIASTDYANDVIRKLHEAGYLVEMDDFGSGYSSLNVLKDVEFDIIKLDMKFFSGDESSKRGRTIISSIIQMSKALELPVIAEGVEKVSQADMLNEMGCSWIQGYLYSKPLPQAEFEKCLEEDGKKNK